MRLKIANKRVRMQETTTIERPDELKRADMMLKYFKKAEKGVHPVTNQQVELIKTYWEALHWYVKAQFSFNDNYTFIIKR